MIILEILFAILLIVIIYVVMLGYKVDASFIEYNESRSRFHYDIIKFKNGKMTFVFMMKVRKRSLLITIYYPYERRIKFSNEQKEKQIKKGNTATTV